jgi:eukaryotic-like serine/threonine-protein kinase
VLARPPSRLYLLEKMVRRNKLLVSSAALVTTSRLVGLGISTVLFLREKDARERAVAAEKNEEALRRNETELRREAEARELAARYNSYVSDLRSAVAPLADGNLGFARDLLSMHRPAPGQKDLRGFEWRYLWGLSQDSNATHFTAIRTT